MSFHYICAEQAKALEKNPSILYELEPHDYSYIKNIIVNMNLLGFYTFTSQPGLTITDISGYEYRQRALIRGYMYKTRANALFAKLSKISHIFVRTEDYNIQFDMPIKVGSIWFRNNKPVSRHNGDFAFDLSLPLRKPAKKLIADICPEASTGVLTEIEIVDRRWCENEDFWTVIIQELSDIP